MELRRGAYLKRGEYTILSKLGRGGFGITYLAIQARSNMQVCVKEFFPEEFYYRRTNSNDLILSRPDAANRMERFKRKFINEARIISRMRHPNIVHIYDTFEENNTVYYVMEYIDGMSLADAIARRGAMSEEHSRYYISQVAGALHHVHRNHILHLDVKPGNIMLRRSDNRAILIDFGISKGYDDDGNPLSSTYSAVSHGFAPFEQYTSGAMDVFSPETDIYALGATLYNMLTGKVPPQALDLIDSPLPALPSNISEGTQRAVVAAMRFRREERPHSIEAFLTILQSGMVEDVPPQSSRLPQQPSMPLGERGLNEPNTDGGKRTRNFWILAILSIAAIAMILVVPISRVIRGNYQTLNTATNKTHTEVDLGLSVNWAACNVGADYPWSNGDCYAWGEIYTKNNYSENTYTGPNINDISGSSRYDVARSLWGGGWRMPTREELNELIQRCTWELDYNKGVYGYYVTGPSGRSIFLPLAGGYSGNVRAMEGKFGRYWSSPNMNDRTAYGLGLFSKQKPDIGGFDWKYMGGLIRPVRDKR